ncbi:MAG: type I CRISPR-associated protein Cas7 [Candidatus Schekmanbacteria bacterium]|nr:type I CRISPR-associated protein Cas7 [Candidatus Schekmanbacteria bacterium]
MSDNTVRSGEILFIKAVKDGIPNRDPLRDSDARRLFGEEDGRISLSDVSIKRDVRDYVLARHADGGPGRDRFVFVRKEFSDGGKLLGRENLAKTLLARAGRSVKDTDKASILSVAFDARAFGIVFSVGDKAFNQVGPVQFGWAHSLHPVETRYTQGTVVMPSKDTNTAADAGAEAEGSTQGTIWTMYTVPFAVFAMPAVISSSIARDTGLSAADLELLLEALWRGTSARQARGRGLQRPLLLLHVEYRDPFDRIGYLEEGIALEPGRESWLGGKQPTSVADVSLDVRGLAGVLEKNVGRIARARVWRDERLAIRGELPAEVSVWPPCDPSAAELGR